ncbi:hypothetical protein [Proteus mirabilis]|nr:hypothetical protein [Proteus mirabilis]
MANMKDDGFIWLAVTFNNNSTILKITNGKFSRIVKVLYEK